MLYNVCSLNQPTFLENTEKSDSRKASKNTNVYDISYMIQKYEDVSLNYLQWLATKIIFNGDGFAVQMDSFNEHFGSNVFNYLNVFKEVKVIGESKESSLKLKATLKSVFPAVHFPDSLDFDIENHSIDVVYAIAQRDHVGEIRMFLLSEVLRMLNCGGKFYLTFIVEDYDVAIKQLYKEFEPSYEFKCDGEIHFEETKLYLTHHFNLIEVDEFIAIMKITDIDDLIAHVLSDGQYIELKSIIARTGLSKFRNFLLNKIKSDGAIIMERRMKLVSCYHAKG